ncbi:hypothetical protein ACHAWO_007979 [Cyclotella atomus]|uniref:Uncharacterized protein n=1 Tax=Cyclotella atomus TaxID=382360 RepID=A0ABD3QAA6_9STRA
MYLRTAYAVAVERLGKTTQNWTEGCCRVAIALLKSVGIHIIVCPRTVALYNQEFRDHNGRFTSPNPYAANRIKCKPLLFELIPRFKVDIKEYVFDNHAHFHAEMLKEELIYTMIPNKLAELRTEAGQHYDEIGLLESYIQQPPSIQTVRMWLNMLNIAPNRCNVDLFSSFMT